MKTILSIFIAFLLLCNFYVSNAQNTIYAGDVLLETAYQRFWRGDITFSTDEIKRNIESAELTFKSGSVKDESRFLARKAALKAFSLYIQAYYELSIQKSGKELNRLLCVQMEELEKVEFQTKDSTALAGLFLTKALLYERLRKYDQFLIWAQKALEIAPEWPYAMASVGDAYFYLHQYEPSFNYLKRSLKMDSTLLNTYYFLGWAYTSTNNPGIGIELATKALSINPKFFLAYNLLSRCYSDLGMPDKEEYYLKKAIEINPKWLRAYSNLANCYKNQGRKAEAIGAMKQVLAINPNWAAAFETLGDFYNYDYSNSDSAAYYYFKCIDSDPGYAECYAGLGDLYRNKKDQETALGYFKKAIEADSTYFYPYQAIGEMLFSINKHRLSLPYFSKASILNPRSFAVVRLAEVYNLIGDFQNSIETWEQAIKQDPSQKSYRSFSESPYAGLSNRLLEKDSIEKAVELLEKGARMGNRFSKYAVLGLKYEFGINTAPDFSLALFYYKKRCERISLPRSYFIKRILSLYENGKVAFDSTDYTMWKGIEKNGLKQFTVPCITESGARRPIDLYIQYEYPSNVHPMAWEAERIQEEQSATIPVEVMESFQKLLQLSRKNGVNFPELCVYALDAANEEKAKAKYAQIEALADSLHKRILVSDLSEKIILYDQLSRIYLGNYSLKDKNYNRYRASNIFLEYATIVFKQQYYPAADSLLEFSVKLDSSNLSALRLFALCKVKKEDIAGLQDLYKTFSLQPYEREHTGWTYGDYFYKDLEEFEINYGPSPILKVAQKAALNPVLKLRKNMVSFEDICRQSEADELLMLYKYYSLLSKNEENTSSIILLLTTLVEKHKKENLRVDLLEPYLERLKGDFDNNELKVKAEEVYRNIIENKSIADCDKAAEFYWDFWSVDDILPIKLYAMERMVNLMRVKYNAMGIAEASFAEKFANKIRIYVSYLMEDSQFEKAYQYSSEGLKAAPSNNELLVYECCALVSLKRNDEAQKIWSENANELISSGSSEETFAEALIKKLAYYEKNKILSKSAYQSSIKSVQKYVTDKKLLVKYGLIKINEVFWDLSSAEQTKLMDEMVDLAADEKDLGQTSGTITELVQMLIKAGRIEEAMYLAKALKSKYDDEDLDGASKIKCSKMAADFFSNIYDAFSSNKELSMEIANECGSFSFVLLKFKEFNYGLKMAELAYKANPDEKYVRTNLPIAYLLNDDYAKAETFYLKFKDDEFEEGKTYKKVFLEDIADLISQGVSHRDYAKIVKLLMQ